MVGLSDIPFVGKALDRISEVAVDAVFRGFRYTFFYKDGVNDLNSEIEKLNIQENSMSRKATAERANGKIIDDRVLKWHKDAEDIQESAKKNYEIYKNKSSWRCIPCLPIAKPVSRFRLGREAVQISKTVTKLTDIGKELLANEIAHLPPVEYIPKNDTVFQNFQSRKDAYGELWDALVTEGDPLILGIYGMPGVGKTRMMEQIWKEAKEKEIFDTIARADVGSENLDVMKLQNQIAGYLRCNYESEVDVELRASQLKYSLMNGKMILVMLDNVWSVIPLDVIGLSFGDVSSSKGCKILMTSREQDVCLRNNCKHAVKITTLADDEAWNLFRNIVGTYQIDSLQDESLARKLCKKCAGLPLLICAVGKAVQFSSHNLWKDALIQLEKGKFENIVGIDPQVYACIKLSIDRIPDDAKSCLFLCSLFPEDARIYIRTLIQLAAGSELVPDGESRVRAMVDFLINSLLLDCQEHHMLKLHDIIRDVGRSIAVTDPKYAFLHVRCGLRLPDNADYGTRKFLRLDVDSYDVHFPNDLVCPDLHSLWLNCHNYTRQFSGGFFSIFANLRFLWVEKVLFSLQQQFSLQPLGKLKTLFLHGCYISQTDDLFPENLETLCIWYCCLPSQLRLPNLKYLRKLEVLGEGLYIVRDTISSLSSLEELHIPNGFKICADGFAVPDPILTEISKLVRLTSLQMFFRDSVPFQYTNIFCNLVEFHIRVGVQKLNFTHRASPVLSTRVIELSGYQLDGLENLMERAEELILRCTDVKVSSICNRNREAYANLRKLFIQHCDTMGHLARISRDELQLSCQPHTSFSNLTNLEIRNCSTMKYLFCNSVAKRLKQVQNLSIFDCPLMEVIIMSEGTSDGDIINFSKLKSLMLSKMQRLTSFYGEKEDLHSSSTSIVDNSAIPSVKFQPLFNGMVAFPSLEILRITNLEDTSDIWGKYYYNDNVSFCQLKSLFVCNCNKLEIVIPPDMLHRLQNLEYLSIYSCSSLISEVGTYGGNTAECQLGALRDMELVYLPCLTKTGLNSMNHSCAMTLYPNLQHLKIWDCDSLENVFRPYIARELVHLEEISVVGCEKMKEIIGEGANEITDGIVFPEMMVLQLTLLPNLTRFWCYQSGEVSSYKVRFPKLVNFELSCGEINLESIEFSGDDSACELMSLDVTSDKDLQLPCKWQLRLYNLEILILRHCWSHEMKSLSFQRLKVLKIYSSGCSTLFTFLVLKSLKLLQKLVITNCDLLEEIVEDLQGDVPSGMDKETITLFHLQSVTLKDLPNLKSFLHGANYECHMPDLKEVEVDNCGLSSLFTWSVFQKLQQLETFQVSNCRLLEGIVEDVRGDEASVKNYKIITLFQLSSVFLRDLANLKCFLHNAKYECHMPALKEVEVHSCGLFTLFRCSVFRNLQQLKRLRVSNCRLLEGIVEDAGGDETCDKNYNIITLFRLSSVYLRDLPNLKSFIDNANHEFQMPDINEVEVDNCGQSTLFSIFPYLQQLENL